MVNISLTSRVLTIASLLVHLLSISFSHCGYDQIVFLKEIYCRFSNCPYKSEFAEISGKIILTRLINRYDKCHRYFNLWLWLIWTCLPALPFPCLTQGNQSTFKFLSFLILAEASVLFWRDWLRVFHSKMTMQYHSITRLRVKNESLTGIWP